MSTPLWRYPGLLNGRIEASNSLLTSVLSSYYYGRTGGVWPEYDSGTGGYEYTYGEDYGYYTGHVWCNGEDGNPLTEFRFKVGDYASMYQDDVNDLHSISYVEYLCELRISKAQPHWPKRLLTGGTVEFYNIEPGVPASETEYPFGAWDIDVPTTLNKAGVPIIILPASATLFTEADTEKIVEITGGANAGVYRISAVPWNIGNVSSAPGTNEYLNGRIALLELADSTYFASRGSISGVTVEMLGLRWVARAYYDGVEANYLEESLRDGPGNDYPSAGYHSWARTMHVHMSKAASGPLRTIKYEVKLEAIDSTWSTVAAASGLACKVPAPAYYIDELYRLEDADPLNILNVYPQNGETGVPAISDINLHVVSFTAAAALNQTVKVWVTRSRDTVRHLVYDQAGGGFQAGWNGLRSSAVMRASPESGTDDELLLIIDPEDDFESLELVLVEVEASNDASHDLIASYSFQIEDLTAPEIEEILWLTPRTARLKFSEPVLTGTTPGGSCFIQYADSAVEIINGSEITFPGSNASTDWEGFTVVIANSYPENAGPWTITEVNEATGRIVLNTTSLRADSGADRSAAGTLVQQRDIKASVSPYHLAPRLADEAAAHENISSLQTQCAFCPVPKSATVPLAASLPANADTRQYVVLEFHDDISIGRMYEIHGTEIEDLYENRMDDSSLDFTSPTFGSPERRLNMWSNGIIPATDRRDDLEASSHLRKLAVVIQDLLNVLWYRVDEIQYLDDPGRCPLDWVEHMLYELGNPFRFPLDTELLRRQLANALPGFYKKVGTEQGIEAMLYLLLGIKFDLVPYLNADYWRLDFSRLGIETILGPGSAWGRNAYEVYSPVTLTDAQRRIVWDVCEWADPANMHLVRIVEPGDTPIVGQYWVLNVSALNMSTTLSD